jgi:hypothetical protein
LIVATLGVDCALLRQSVDGGYGTSGLEAGAVFVMTNVLAFALYRASRRGPTRGFLLGFAAAGMVAIVTTIVGFRSASDTTINELGHFRGHMSAFYETPCRWLLPGLFAPELTVRDELIGYALTPAFIAIEFSPFTLAQILFAVAGGLLAKWAALRRIRGIEGRAEPA